ncbi:phage gp16-like protein [Inhella inkyongensis]|uniref:Phage gp16-like protein n=1 Tax=Inhella inkyongensis TaxID=392593 RepID=A0A840S762_9BURK|nr:regulatory protein GemA [Inhella inkyongensis]MBB5204411.1 phage gp16-like protein [Inhella inkyongensis]
MSKPAPAASGRRATLIKLIHVAKRELQLEEDTYRTLLHTASGGQTSTAAMNERQLQAVLEQAKRSGFVVRSGGVKPRRLDRSPEGRKVRALWLFLHHLAAVRDPSEAALASYCKRIAGVDDLHWASHLQMNRLTETLKKWALRDALPHAIAALERELAEQPDALSHAMKSSVLAQAAGLRRLPKPGYDAHLNVWRALNHVLGRPGWASTADMEALTE